MAWPERRAAVAALALLLLACVAGGAVAERRPAGESEAKAGLIEALLRPSGYLPESPELVATGRRVYEKHCAPCHGVVGDGQGEAAYLLYPKPRDFTRGEYRVVSTWDLVPTDHDLYLTISRGMPGSAMPSWSHLPEEQRWGLVHYVKRFSKVVLDVNPAREPAAPGEIGAGPLQPPARPPVSPELLERGRHLFLEGCAACHGQTARGDGQQRQQDSQGYPTQPRDLTAGVFKGAPEPNELYRRIVLGLPGSPMPTSAYLHGDDGWALTEYVLALSSPPQRERVEMKRYRIVATRTSSLPLHPDDGAWRAVPPVDLHLMPLWWRPGRPEVLTVKALHDGQDLALSLQWADATHDHTAIRPQDFRDAAAIEFSPVPDPPFFGMGSAGQEVSLWMWKAERQADLEPAFQDLEKIYPHIGIDSYPNLERSPLEQPTRHGLTLESDKSFITGWGAGNIVSDPTRGSPVENLHAQGFGTLRARPSIDQRVRAMGSYDFGSYRTVFVRVMGDTGPDARLLAPGRTLPVAFAVWDGSAGDRDGKKSVTIWQELHIER
jgi:mono/diheme cytochrome c family protein